jgi:uncharacterized protein YndB with AHSA1/START domain
MAHNEIDIDAPPDTVFDVLANPASYGHWVAGARKVHAADPEWPAPGSVFVHTQGWGPLPLLADLSAVLESRRPELLRMRVQARPFTVAHVTLRLHAQDGGTRVEMDEVAANLASMTTMNPLTDPLIRLRNAESLRRLKRMAEGKDPVPSRDVPPRSAV